MLDTVKASDDTCFNIARNTLAGIFTAKILACNTSVGTFAAKILARNPLVGIFTAKTEG